MYTCMSSDECEEKGTVYMGMDIVHGMGMGMGMGMYIGMGMGMGMYMGMSIAPALTVESRE